MKKYMFLLLMVFCLFSCKKAASDQLMSKSEMVAVDTVAYANYAPNEDKTVTTPDEPSDKKIIRTADISISSKNITKSKAAMDTLIKKFRGYYETENFSNDYNLSYALTIRIPQEGFDKFIAALENGTDKITQKNISSSDVTREYIDLESRIKSKRIYLDRLHELAKQAKTVKDLLEVEEQTRTLVEEIESSEQQFRYLSKQVSYSTITITITQEKEYTPAQTESFGKNLLESLGNGWSIVRYLFFFLITIWPLYIIAALVIFIIKKIKLRKRKNGSK